MQYARESLGLLLGDALSETRETLYARHGPEFSTREIDRLMDQPFAVRHSLYAAWLRRPKAKDTTNYAVPTARTPLPDGAPSPWTSCRVGCSRTA